MEHPSREPGHGSALARELKEHGDNRTVNAHGTGGRALFFDVASSHGASYISATTTIMSLLLILILLAVLFLISAALVILVIGPLILLQPVRRDKDWYARLGQPRDPREAGLPFRDITLTTRDGVKLKGWLIPSARRAPKGSVIYLHGVGDCKTAGLQLAAFLHKQGFHVLLYDSRAHGESGGRYCTYGYYEKHDVTTAIDFLMKQRRLKPGKVGLFGTSMGAAVALQAAAIDKRIKGVAAEAAFTDLRTISVDYQRRIAKLPWHFLRNVAMARSQAIAQFKAREVSPLRDVARLHIPVLFIHGMDDKFINYEYSKMLYHQANEPKDIFLVPGANHTDIWEISETLYEKKLLSFFSTVLR